MYFPEPELGKDIFASWNQSKRRMFCVCGLGSHLEKDTYFAIS
jgi:hypothetical protein